MHNNKYSNILDIFIILIAIGISVFLIVDYNKIKTITADVRESSYVRPVNEKIDLIYGNPKADLFIVEYGDLECPFCKDFHPNMKSIIESDWGISGRVAWVWRNGFHINNTSIEKAKTLECVRKFSDRRVAWKFIEESLSGGVLEEEYPFDRYASIFEELNLPQQKIESCRRHNEAKNSIGRSAYDIQQLNIKETPYLQFITRNGELLFEGAGVLTRSQLESFISNIIQSKDN